MINYSIFTPAGALSSVGSEHLVYTQGVGGSNPSAPTTNTKPSHKVRVFLFSLLSQFSHSFAVFKHS